MRLPFAVAALGLSWAHEQKPPDVSSVQLHSIVQQMESSVVLEASRRSISAYEKAMVTASWEGLPPSAQDAWVGLYLVGEDPLAVVPLKYKFCNSSRPLPGRAGSGNVSFKMLNYRADCLFRLFVGWETPRLIAESDPITVRDVSVPTGVRIAFTAEPGEMQVSWTSVPLQEGMLAQVQYRILLRGVEGRSGVLNAVGSSYGRGDLCGAPANTIGYRDPGMFYSAIIGGLRPGEEVVYSVGSAQAWSQEFSFQAPLPPGSPVRLLVVGDLGQDPGDASAQADNDPWYSQWYAWGDPGAMNTTSGMWADHQATPANAILHNGDLSYAMGFLSLWDVFHDNIEPLSARVPWMVTLGNHERDWPESGSTAGDEDSLGECGVPALTRFPMPYQNRKLPPLDEPWYTLQLGCVYVVALSTEHELRPGSPQHAFLTKALQRVDRTVTPWVVLEGHRPYHISSSWDGDQDFARYYREAVGDLVEEHVDVILGAHHHTYQRTCRFRAGRCVGDSEEGVLNMIIGMGGASHSRPNATMPPLFEYVDHRNFGYARLLANTSALTIEFVHGADRAVHDSITLTKHRRSSGSERAPAEEVYFDVVV